MSRVSDRRRGIGLSTGFITQIQYNRVSPDSISLPYNSRLDISPQFCSHPNRCKPGNRRTPGYQFLLRRLFQTPNSAATQLGTNTTTLQLELSWNFPNSTRNSLSSPRYVYKLWSDRRVDSVPGFWLRSHHWGNGYAQL
jgi:hypothetical protein